MTNDTLLKILGFGFIILILAIAYICVMLPFEQEVKMRSMNAEMVQILITPMSAILGAIFGLRKKDKKGQDGDKGQE